MLRYIGVIFSPKTKRDLEKVQKSMEHSLDSLKGVGGLSRVYGFRIYP